jgi:hypothetical protein
MYVVRTIDTEGTARKKERYGTYSDSCALRIGDTYCSCRCRKYGSTIEANLSVDFVNLSVDFVNLYSSHIHNSRSRHVPGNRSCIFVQKDTEKEILNKIIIFLVEYDDV